MQSFRRILARSAAAFMGVAVMPHSGESFAAGAGTPAPRPNIILIMADVLRCSSEGRLNAVHRNGTVCPPKRVGLLTGRYSQRCDWVGDEELSAVFWEQHRQNPAVTRGNG